MSYMPQSKSDTHITPDEVFDVIRNKWNMEPFSFYDPCPANADFDGLKVGWHDWNYINPPYAAKKGERQTMLDKFVRKALAEQEQGNYSIMLLPSKTDQDWFHELIKRNLDIHWFDHRLKFKNNKDRATQPHFLVMIR